MTVMLPLILVRNKKSIEQPIPIGHHTIIVISDFLFPFWFFLIQDESTATSIRSTSPSFSSRISSMLRKGRGVATENAGVTKKVNDDNAWANDEVSHHSTILNSAHIRKSNEVKSFYGANDRMFRGAHQLFRANPVIEDESCHSIILDSEHIREMPQSNRSVLMIENGFPRFRSPPKFLINNSGGSKKGKKKANGKDESDNALLDPNAVHGRRSLQLSPRDDDVQTSNTETIQKKSYVPTDNSHSGTFFSSSSVPFQVLSPSFAVHRRTCSVAKTKGSAIKSRKNRIRLVKPPLPPPATPQNEI
jgi:hypothetical protein